MTFASCVGNNAKIMKIPVFCSLIPSELISFLGHEPVHLAAEELTSVRPEKYHCSFHENLCSYSKVLYDYFLRHHEDYGLIIVPTSCDAMKKLYNALRIKLPHEKLYVLDVPKKKGDASARFLTGELEKVSRALGDVNAVTGVSVGHDVNKVWRPRRIAFTASGAIAILGSNVPMGVFRECAEKYGLEIVMLNHCLEKSYPDEKLINILANDGIEKYATAFLEKNSCPRTNDTAYKERFIEKIRGKGFQGIIVNALKFCDFHPFDFKYLREALGADFPALIIEHELTANYEGQTMTRLEAFFENIHKRLGGYQRKITKPRGGKYFVGIDSGSHATKLVCINKDGKVVSMEVVPTGTSVRNSAVILLEKLEAECGISRRDIARLVATGYGRNKVVCADDVVTEISCHALGAFFKFGRPSTVIDIGGQDSKVIKVGDGGSVVRFAMNDKCAAGTGRFLEVMAAKLEMDIDDFAELAFNTDKSVPISSMCSVFAESEVISLIASGKTKEEIAKGIHSAIAERTIALARRIDGEPPYCMAGGVARNKGLVRELSERLGHQLEVLENPQFSGALGAALIAMRGL